MSGLAIEADTLRAKVKSGQLRQNKTICAIASAALNLGSTCCYVFVKFLFCKLRLQIFLLALD